MKEIQYFGIKVNTGIREYFFFPILKKLTGGRL